MKTLELDSPYFTQRSDCGICEGKASMKIKVAMIGAYARERGNGTARLPTRPVTYLCLCTLRISFEDCERTTLFE